MVKNLDSFIYKGFERDDKQTTFEIDSELNQFVEDDWTFKSADTAELTHTIFSNYPARMIPQIARKLIDLYYPKYPKSIDAKPILDPFAGSGSSCLEALLKNINSIGFDLNPLSQIIVQGRTAIIEPNLLRNHFKKLKNIIKLNQNRKYEEYFPDEKNLNYWYNEKVLQDLSILRYAIEVHFSYEEIEKENNLGKIKNFFLLCLAKAARECSYQRKGEHKSYRIPKKKIPIFDQQVNVFKHFKKIYIKYSSSLNELYKYYTSNNLSAKCEAIFGDSRKLKGIKDNSIDLIVTSPPYGDSHTTVAYGQYSRFPLEWIKFKRNIVSDIDNKLLGGIKKDVDDLNTPLFFETSRNILIEEIKQQNRLLNDYINIILDFLKEKKKSTVDIEIPKDILNFKRKVKEAIEFETKVQNSRNIKELIDLKNSYFNFIKVLRTFKNNMEKELNSNYKSLEFMKFKIYDERLPYVLSFFSDLLQVLRRLFHVLDYNRKCCIVIGNRTVKRVKIPTDQIIIDLGKDIGFEHIITYYREIPNKRIPQKTSPTNIKGEKLSTIMNESIIILNKPAKID